MLAVAGDLNYPAEILYDWRTRRFLDFGQPVCLILAMTMHFFPPDQAGKITAELIAGLPPGSYVIMSVVGGDAELGEHMARTYTAAPVYNHGPGGLAHFLRDLDIIAPGITQARHWRAPVFVPGHRRGQAWAAVGRKPPARQPRRGSHDRGSRASPWNRWPSSGATPTSSATPATSGPLCAATPAGSSPPTPWTNWPPPSKPTTRPPGPRDYDPPGTADYLGSPG